MSRTVSRLFNTHTEAMTAVSELEQAGVSHHDISLVASNADNWHDGHRHDTAHVDGDNETAEGAVQGATTGGLIGAGGGLLAGLGMLAIPGLGPVVAAGWLVATVVGAAAGAATGAAAGGVLGALKDAGHSDEDAHVFAEGVRRGGTLVSVKTKDDETARIEQILQHHHGVDALTRGQDYRSAGWNSFDQSAAPYTADEVVRERQRYGESRSFLNQDGRDDSLEADRDRRPGGPGITAPIPGTDI